MILYDNQGNMLAVGDKIMYVTDRRGINYGTIQKIERVNSWGYEHWKVEVLKTMAPYLKEPTVVYLTEPVMFRCDVVLRSQTIEE